MLLKKKDLLNFGNLRVYISYVIKVKDVLVFSHSIYKNLKWRVSFNYLSLPIYEIERENMGSKREEELNRKKER